MENKQPSVWEGAHRYYSPTDKASSASASKLAVCGQLQPCIRRGNQSRQKEYNLFSSIALAAVADAQAEMGLPPLPEKRWHLYRVIGTRSHMKKMRPSFYF
jgi:hypothetical protein